MCVFMWNTRILGERVSHSLQYWYCPKSHGAWSVLLNVFKIVIKKFNERKLSNLVANHVVNSTLSTVLCANKYFWCWHRRLDIYMHSFAITKNYSLQVLDMLNLENMIINVSSYIWILQGLGCEVIDSALNLY